MKNKPESIQLPRSAAGTAFGRGRNIFAFTILSVAVVIGFGLDYAFGRNNLRTRTINFIGENSEIEEERKMLMGLTHKRSAKSLQDLEIENERIDLPYNTEDSENQQLNDKIYEAGKIKLFSDIKLVEFNADRKEVNAETSSKYFNVAEQISNIDDLNESKEFATRKIVKKNPPSGLKTKKPTIRKQRIKKASKNGDIRKYTDDFQKICSNGGIDVDPDHLQLAIALSQSLVDFQQNNLQDIESRNSTSIEKKSKESNTANLKKILEQYGFKVSSNYDNATRNEKKSYKYKRRKNYHLIDKNQDQKAEIVSNKISEILFENIRREVSDKENSYEIISESLKELLCVNNCCFEKLIMSYKDMKDELYYVPNLITPSGSKMGCLLKDWSTIPGREKSPERTTPVEDFKDNVKFKDLNNLDVLLSEPLSKVTSAINSEQFDSQLIEIKNCNRSDSPDIFNDESFNKTGDDCTVHQSAIENDVINVLTSSDDDHDDDDNLPDVYISQPIKSNPINISEVIEIDDFNYKPATQDGFKNVSKNISVLNDSNDDVEMCEDGNGIMHYESYCDLSFNKSENGKHNVSIDLDSSSDSIIIDDKNDNCNNSQENVSSGLESSNKKTDLHDNSDVFMISDDEFNYSMKKPRTSEQFKSLYEDIFDQDDHKTESKTDCKDSTSNIDVKASITDNENYYNFSKMYRSSILNSIHTNNSINPNNSQDQDSEKHVSSIVDCKESRDDVTRDTGHNIFCNESPVFNKYIVKTGNVTPMTDCSNIKTPDIIKELSKYGLKPLKRKRAVQILEHIYEQTHPLVDATMLENVRKKSKLDDVSENEPKTDHKNDADSAKLKSDTDAETRNIYLPDSEDFVLKSIDCDPDDWIFQTREKSKLHSCRVPLHIVFHNYLCRRTKLRETILKYEPVDIGIIYKDFAANGFKCKPKELMSFFDKKCIAVKTVNKSTRVKGSKRKVK